MPGDILPDHRRPSGKGKGRPKGKPNNLTARLRKELADAYERLGGLDGFVEWAEENRTEFYRIYMAQLPRPIEVKADITVEGVRRLTGPDLEGRLERSLTDRGIVEVHPSH